MKLLALLLFFSLAKASWAAIPFDHALFDDQDGTIGQIIPIAQELSQPETVDSVTKRLWHESLVRHALRYQQRPHIPYIWGGHQAGTSSQCKACRRCVKKTKADLKIRKKVCKACQKCGLDCSHFIVNVYNDAGFKIPFLTTAAVNKASGYQLRKKFNLVNLGRKLTKSQPGDLLLYPKHIVLLVRNHGQGLGDVIHATLLGDKHKLGGIKLERNVNLKDFRGKLKRILRHKSFSQALLQEDVALERFNPQRYTF